MTTLDTAPRGARPTRQLSALIRAEVRKTTSNAAWWALLLPAAALALACAALVTLTDRPAAAQAFALTWFPTIFVLLFGALTVTTEYRHDTVTTGYLVAADRPKLLAAKAVVAAAVGVLYALVCIAAGIGGLLLARAPVSGSWTTVLQVSAGSLPVFALWAIIGVGIGSLIKNQVAAVVAAIVGPLLFELVIGVTVEQIGWTGAGEFLPLTSSREALLALTGGEQFGGGFGVGHPWWLFLLVFAGYAVLAGLAGLFAAQRRDIG